MKSERFRSWPQMAIALCLGMAIFGAGLEAQVTTATVYGRVIDPRALSSRRRVFQPQTRRLDWSTPR